jgi:RNA 2',3'-cyclic 3'-phosphodiesterase
MRPMRLFIAVDVAAEVAARAGRIAGRLREAGVEAAWVPTDRMHLTLHFLGDDVDDADLHKICVAVDDAAATVPPFRLECGGVGVFPDARRPRVAWLGVREGNAELVALHAALASRLAPLGFPPEARVYRPHLTLGRFRGGRDAAGPGSDVLLAALAACRDAEGGSTAVQRVCLYESRLAREGAAYDRLHAAALRG